VRNLLEESFLRSYLDSKVLVMSQDERKNREYLDLVSKIFRCYKCPLRKIHPWPGSGNLDSKIMIVGESPSPNRKSFENFSERSREIVDKVLEILKTDRSKVYITNALKCSTYKADPHDVRRYMEICNEYLVEEIRIVRPKLVITFGEIALKAVNLALKKLNYPAYVVNLPHPMSVVYGTYSLEEYLKMVKQKCGLIRYLI